MKGSYILLIKLPNEQAIKIGIILCETGERAECTIAEALSRQFDAIPGFGCSDCRCPSHLFFSTKEMKPIIMAILKRLAKARAGSWLIRSCIVK